MSMIPQQTTQMKFGTFELAEALGSAEAALVVLKLRSWLTHNQTYSPHISYRDGRWWSFSSLKVWCKRDFKWLTPRQLGTIMKKLVDMNVIVRRQYGASDLKMSYWYSVNEGVIAELVAETKQVNAFDDSVESSDTSVESPDKNVEYKTTVKQKNLKAKTSKKKQQQQPTAETDVVVAQDLPRQDLEAESGEHSLDSLAGEGHDTTAVKAFVPHEQHYDESALSKVPLKVLSLGNELCADLIRFGVSPDRAQWMVKQYPEDDIRYVMDRARKASNVTNPPGFLVRELEKGKAGVLGLRTVQKDLHMPSTFIDEDRLEAIRRENARMEAEDRERAAGQMMDPEPHLEKV